MPLKQQKIKTFNDGIVNVTQADGSETVYTLDGLRYANEVMGVKRFFAAEAANVKIDRVISTPFIKELAPEMIFDIVADRHGCTGKYTAVEIQKIEDTARPYLKITLRLYERVKTRWEDIDYGI